MWLSSATDLFSLLGDLSRHFEILRCDRERKRGGGVVLFIRRIYSPVLLFKQYFSLAYEIVCAYIAFGNNAVIIVSVYRTPGYSVSMTVQMSKAISDVLSCSTPCVITGVFKFPVIV